MADDDDSCIERFTDSTGRVNLFDRSRNKVRMAAPSDDIFCAQRVWDQRAEAGFIKSIEDDFQALADEIAADKLTTFIREKKSDY